MVPSSTSKRVLVIAYDFPPRRTSGVYRVTHLTKYLNGLGWRPTVLTVTARPGDLEDRTLLRDFPSEVRVERAADLNISGWEDKAAVGIRAAGGLQSHYKDVRQPLRDRWVRAAGHLVRSTFYFPDDTVGWVPLALANAIELHLRHRFDLVYTTSPPRAAPVVGLLLKSILGIPWVAEFRDPWYPPARPWRKRSERWFLLRILKKADRVVVISTGHAEKLETEYGLPAGKAVVVSNGFEESDFDPAPAGIVPDGNPPPAGKCDFLSPAHFHLSHFGTVYPGFSGRFFDALREVLEECPDWKNQIRVNVIGFPDDTIRQVVADGRLGGTVRVFDFVKHDVAIEAMRASDVLLVFLGGHEIARLSGVGKIYDYLRVGRPVLAVAYEGGTAEIVRAGRAGWVVNPEDTAAIKDVLRTIVQNGRKGNLPGPANPEFVAQFRYDRLAGKLAEVLNSVVRDGS